MKSYFCPLFENLSLIIIAIIINENKQFVKFAKTGLNFLKINNETIMVQNILFDLGGVLIDWDPHVPYIEIFGGNEEKAEWFIKNICTSEWNTFQDAGRSFEEAISERISDFPEYHEEIKAYFIRWEEMLKGEIAETVQILEHLHRKQAYGLYAVTNWSAETFPIAYKKYGFLKFFRDIAVSGELKMIKPNPEIFMYIMEKHDLNPETCIFIDDNETNTVAAENLGFKTILFKNPEQLKVELFKLGVNVN